MDPTIERPKRWVIFISGFMQNEAERTGIEDAWLFARRYVSTENVVIYRRWDDDMAALAGRIMRLSGTEAEVVIVAYSWGVGNGARKLAQALYKYGVSIQRLVACDGVYKPRLKLSSWRALIPCAAIYFPPNVRSIWWCRQFNSIIQGHPIKIKGFNVPPSLVLRNQHHNTIDEDPAFHRAVADALEELLNVDATSDV